MNYFDDMKDVLTETREPKLERIKTAGFVTLIYLLIGIDKLMGRDGNIK